MPTFSLSKILSSLVDDLIQGKLKDRNRFNLAIQYQKEDSKLFIHSCLSCIPTHPDLIVIHCNQTNYQMIDEIVYQHLNIVEYKHYDYQQDRIEQLMKIIEKHKKRIFLFLDHFDDLYTGKIQNGQDIIGCIAGMGGLTEGRTLIILASHHIHFHPLLFPTLFTKISIDQTLFPHFHYLDLNYSKYNPYVFDTHGHLSVPSLEWVSDKYSYHFFHQKSN